MTVVHAGVWLTVANSSTVALQWGKLVLQGGTRAQLDLPSLGTNNMTDDRARPSDI